MNEVKAAKHLGQHFLRDEAVIARLLAVINAKAGERILEIGPGLGALTLPLLRQSGALTAVEYDPRVLAPLTKKAAALGTLHLIHADILTIDFAELLAAESPPSPSGEGDGGGVRSHTAAAESPSDIPPPPVGEGRGGGSEHSAPATSTLPSPRGGGDGGGAHPHTTNAESPADLLLSPQDAQASAAGDWNSSSEGRESWGGGKASTSSTIAPSSTITNEAFTAPHSPAELPPSPRGGGDGGGVRLHPANAESPTAALPPPVGVGQGGGSEHSAPAINTPPSPRGGGDGGGVRLHTANAESSTEKLRLVGNLPYNLSSPILFHCLAQRQHIHDMHYMLQKEVVDRITAAPGSKTYGRLSLMAQLWCETTALFDIPPDAFEPPPKVDSAVVRLVPRAAPAWQIDDLATFEETVRLAFAQRRKMLRKTFAHWMSESELKVLDIDPTARAETLDGAAFARLANARYQQERQQ